jgi:SAM-dependent methyltransferase
MGIRGVLGAPQIYEAWSRLVGSEHGRSTLVRDHVRPWSGARVLDLGCGPGDLVRHLGDVDYVGVDSSEEYIASARRSYGQAEFRVGDATALDADLRDFDLVLAFGLIHHLDDRTAESVFKEARRVLAQAGRFVGVDPTILQERGPLLARLLIAFDRGDHVRTPEEYRRLAERNLKVISNSVRTDLLRVPYSQCILEAQQVD